MRQAAGRTGRARGWRVILLILAAAAIAGCSSPRVEEKSGGGATQKLPAAVPQGAAAPFRNARRIINNIDQAALIAQYANTIEGILKAAIVP